MGKKFLWYEGPCFAKIFINTQLIKLIDPLKYSLCQSFSIELMKVSGSRKVFFIFWISQYLLSLVQHNDKWIGKQKQKNWITQLKVRRICLLWKSASEISLFLASEHQLLAENRSLQNWDGYFFLLRTFFFLPFGSISLIVYL